MKQTVTITQDDYDEAARLRRAWYNDENNVNPLLRSPTALALARQVALPSYQKWAVSGIGLTRFSRRRDLDRARAEVWAALPAAVVDLERHWGSEGSLPCPHLPLTFECDPECVPFAGQA